MSSSRYLWITPATEVRWIWGPLGAELYRRHGLIPLFIVGTEQDRQYYLSKVPEGVPAEAVVAPDRYSLAFDTDGLPPLTRAIETLTEFEQDTGCCFARDVLLPDRQFARAYVFGGDKVARSKITARASQETVWRVGAVMVSFFRDLTVSHPPGLFVCLSGGTGLIGRPIAALVDRLGVPMRNLVHTRFGFRYYWAEDPVHNSARMNSLLEAEPMPDDAEVERVQATLRPTGDFEFYVNRMRKRRRLDRLALQVAQNIYKHIRYHLGRSRKAKIGYYMTGEIGMILNGRSQARYLTGPSCRRLADLPDGHRYVFFPLQVEPEVSLHGLVPDLFDQVNTVAKLAMNLPADGILIVKEHPAQIGRRSTSFYKRIQAIPNVRLISELEHSYPVMRRCDLIVAVTSSAAHESAVMGRKVAYLSANGPLLTVPHVRHLDPNSGFSALRDLMNGDDWGTEEERKRAGARYYIGLERHAVDFAYIGTELFNRDRVPTSEEIAAMADTLDRSIDGSVGAAA